jgi:hypothetical protein
MSFPEHSPASNGDDPIADWKHPSSARPPMNGLHEETLDICDPAARQALGEATGKMRDHEHDEFKLLLALRDGAAALEPFNDPAALEHLVLMATDRFGIGADIAQNLIKQGCDLAVTRRAERPTASKADGADKAPKGVTVAAKKTISALRASCGDRNGSALDCARKGAAVMILVACNPVKKHGPWVVAHLRVVTPSGDPV